MRIAFRPDPRRGAGGDERQAEGQRLEDQRLVGRAGPEPHLERAHQPEQGRDLRHAVAKQRRLRSRGDAGHRQESEGEAEDRARRLRHRIGEDTVLGARPFPEVNAERPRHGVDDARERQRRGERRRDERQGQDRRDSLRQRGGRENRTFGLAIIEVGLAADMAHRELRPPGQAEQEDQILGRHHEGQVAIEPRRHPVRPDDHRGELSERTRDLGRKVEQRLPDQHDLEIYQEPAARSPD